MLIQLDDSASWDLRMHGYRLLKKRCASLCFLCCFYLVRSYDAVIKKWNEKIALFWNANCYYCWWNLWSDLWMFSLFYLSLCNFSWSFPYFVVSMMMLLIHAHFSVFVSRINHRISFQPTKYHCCCFYYRIVFYTFDERNVETLPSQ